MSSPNTQPTSAPDISREGQARSPAVSGTPRDEHADSPAPSGSEAYPEQKHAGAVGYGPNYHHGPTAGDKIGGMTEELKGKILRKPDVVEHGHDRRTGELQRKEQEKDDAENPFQAAKDDEESGSSKPTGA